MGGVPVTPSATGVLLDAIAKTVTRPSLREVLIDALDIAYWTQRDGIEGCRDCTRNPAGICADHQADNEAAAEFENARKLIEQSPGHPEVLAVLAGLNGGTA
jgi:hypothetical protein